VEAKQEKSTRMLQAEDVLLVSWLIYFPTAEMAEIFTSEISGYLLTTWRYKPEDRTRRFKDCCILG
jgi:hypothetical protein